MLYTHFFRLLFHATQNPAGIYKSRLDGTAAVEIVSSVHQSPWALAVDNTHEQVCWTDSGKYMNTSVHMSAYHVYLYGASQLVDVVSLYLTVLVREVCQTT